MVAAVTRQAELDDVEWPSVKVPRPLPSGSYSIESMGRWVDRLMGDARARRTAMLRLEPLLQAAQPDDPPPVEVPALVPGATELITRSDDPSTERR